jgi:hypothetical protein
MPTLCWADAKLVQRPSRHDLLASRHTVGNRAGFPLCALVRIRSWADKVGEQGVPLHLLRLARFILVASCSACRKELTSWTS